MKRRSLRVNWLTKGMMKTNNHAFGHDYEHLFGVGDLVSWHMLGKDENIGLKSMRYSSIRRLFIVY